MRLKLALFADLRTGRDEDRPVAGWFRRLFNRARPAPIRHARIDGVGALSPGDSPSVIPLSHRRLRNPFASRPSVTNRHAI